MKYTTEPPVAEKKTLEPIVHTLGENAIAPASEITGAVTDTGPQPAETFPNTDEWKGKPVDSNYGTVPEDKDAVEANLRKVAEENITRFGLDMRGVPDADKAPAK